MVIVAIVVVLNPGIKVDENYKPYTDGMENKVFIMVCVYVCMYVCMYMHVYMCVCVCVYICIHMYVSSCFVCVCV